MDNRFILEQKLNKDFSVVVGVDEVGRGPLAGPVVSAAVYFEKPIEESWWEEIRDSKKVSEKKREALAEKILEHAHIGIGIASVEQIEKINILQASLSAMNLAVADLLKSLTIEHSSQVYVLVDGNNQIPGLSYKQMPLVKGDGLVHSIAAASIVAKVTRDNLMVDLDKKFPQYGFAQHKGYGTLIHREAIKQYGLSSAHRSSFCRNII
ncbi:MAG: ribonuclease HII [Candidatus Doudnabacteria bacterium]